jgi:hypothetical protein
MKSSLFSEEGRAARGGRQLLLLFTFLWLLVSTFGGYLVYEHYTKPNLSPLQRVYLPQYYRSLRRSYMVPFNPQSTYVLLERGVVDPKTKKENLLFCLDQEVVPVLDEDGRIRLSQDGYPVFRLQQEYAAESKSFFWNRRVVSDKVMYGCLRQHFYGGRYVYELFYPSLLAGSLIFFPGLVGAFIGKRRLTRRYLRGKPVRGTRELTPKEYERLHRRDTGLGLEVLLPKKGN